MRAIIGFLIASVLAAVGDREQGRRGGVRLLERDLNSGEDPDDWQISGVRFSKAEDLLRGALDVLWARVDSDAPNFGGLLLNFGSALMEQNRLAEATQYFERALPKVQGWSLSRRLCSRTKGSLRIGSISGLTQFHICSLRDYTVHVSDLGR